MQQPENDFRTPQGAKIPGLPVGSPPAGSATTPDLPRTRRGTQRGFTRRRSNVRLRFDSF